jgi:hypothetical protein
MKSPPHYQIDFLIHPIYTGYKIIFYQKIMSDTQDFESCAPEDLIEQEGPNQGNIKDIELARIGAEAENESRSHKVRNKILGELVQIIPELEEDGRHFPAVRGNNEGENAMRKEVERRATENVKDLDIDPKTKEEFPTWAVDEFDKNEDDMEAAKTKADEMEARKPFVEVANILKKK